MYLRQTDNKNLKWERAQQNTWYHEQCEDDCSISPKGSDRRAYLLPVFELVVRKVQLRHVSAKGSDFGFLARTGDPTAVQHQDAGEVEAIWVTGDRTLASSASLLSDTGSPQESKSKATMWDLRVRNPQWRRQMWSRQQCVSEPNRRRWKHGAPLPQPAIHHTGHHPATWRPGPRDSCHPPVSSYWPQFFLFKI